MSRITGREPRHWHDARGGHRMPDAPRELKPGYLSVDERRYRAHLEEHAQRADSPEPQPDDPTAVALLFEHIASLQATIEKERQLITALRQKAAQAPEEEE